MLTEVAIVPSAPLLVPQLSGPDADETREVRRAVVDAAEDLGASARRWVAVGLDGPAHRFAAFGVDVPVTAAPDGPDVTGPLALLIACWVRAQASTPVRLEPLLVAADAAPSTARGLGVDLAARLHADPEPVGVLIVADGATALSPSAPGGGDRPGAHLLQDSLDAGIAGADTAALADLDPTTCTAEGLTARPVFGVLAGLCGATAVTVRTRFVGAPFGVGYTVATWAPA